MDRFFKYTLVKPVGYIFLFFLLAFFVTGFSQEVKFENFTNDDGLTFISGDSIQKRFYFSNIGRVQEINNALYNLPIDKCHNKEIILIIFVDSTGNTRGVQVKKGAATKKIDSSIVNLVHNFPGKWKPALKDSQNVNFVGSYLFLLHSPTVIKKTSTIETVYFVRKTKTIEVDYAKKCRDNDFYYQNGITAFSAALYAKAIGYFLQSLEENPFDIDSMYNLAVSYHKNNNLTKACEWFGKAADLGDNSARMALAKYCL